MIVAGIDIGNATTEVVVAHLAAGGVTPLAVRRAWTTGMKGSCESAAGAARLLVEAEHAAGERSELLLLARPRPVVTLTAAMQPPPRDAAPLRLLSTLAVGTPAGGGFATGAHVPLRDISDYRRTDEPVVVSVPAGVDFEEAANAISVAQDARVPIVGAVVAGDDAVLVGNRIRQSIPIVDEAYVEELEPGERIALEVAPPGARLEVLSDPIALVAAFSLPLDSAPLLAGLARDLADAPCAALAADRHATTRFETDTSSAWIEYSTDDGTVRATLDRRIVERIPLIRPGSVRAIHVPPDEPLSAATEPLGDRVRDVFAVDLPSIRERFFPQAGAVSLDAVPVSFLVEPAPSSPSVEETLAELSGRPVQVITSEATASRLGARTTPGAPSDSLVCDIGGGTVDVVSDDECVTAAGAGELLTQSVAEALGIHRGVAERVKRVPSLRMETPHIVHDEDGARRFIDKPAPVESLGRLCYMRGATPVPFAERLAPEEWRSLRLTIKQHVIGASVDRALSWIRERPKTLLLCGGAAHDTESVQVVGETMRALGITVGRANVNGRYGPRCAVALGLLHAFRGSDSGGG